MPDYRAYIIGIDGHFIRAEFLKNHPDDATAMDAAKQRVYSTMAFRLPL
jgi:hypothetical protein